MSQVQSARMGLSFGFGVVGVGGSQVESLRAGCLTLDS